MMLRTTPLILILSVSCFLYAADGYCMHGPLNTEITAVTKRVRQYCEYKSPDGAHRVRLFPGSKIYTTDCVECRCSLRGLTCCGFGSHAGTVGLPDDCTWLQDGCQELYVKKNDNSTDCFSGKPIDYLGMTFKPHPDNFIGLDRAKERADGTTRRLPQPSSGKALSMPKPTIEPFKSIQIPNAQAWKYLVPDLSPTKLSRRRPFSEILNEIMTKHIPAAKSPRPSLRLDTIPLDIKSQMRVETSSGGLPHPWHAPLNLQPYYDSSSPGSWLPWVFIE